MNTSAPAGDRSPETAIGPAGPVRLRRAGPILLLALALAGVTEGALWLASVARPRLTIDVGPATGPYVSAFSGSVEFPPVTARWLQPRGRIAPPLDVLPGEGRAWLHLAVGAATGGPVPLEVWLAGRAQARLSLEPSSPERQAPQPGRAANDPFRDTRLVSFPLSSSGGPLDLELRTDELPAQALAVDWLRLEGLRVRVPARALAVRLLPIGVLLLALLHGAARPRAALLALGAVLLVGWCAAAEPFRLVHLAPKVALPALILSLASAGFLRRLPHGAALQALLLAGLLLKGAGVFDPQLHAPDVLTHTRYVAALRQSTGHLIERGVAAQRRAGVGYPRYVAGRPHALPYSPLFHLPFTLLPEERVAGAMKYAAVLLSVAQTGLLFAVARALGGPRLALWSAFLDTFLPPAYYRLVWAMWPATAGHLIDLLAVAALLHWLRRPDERRRLVLLAGAAFLAFVAYISGLVLVGALLFAAALVERRRAGRLLAVLVTAGLATALLVYPSFTEVLFREILPAVRTGGVGVLGTHAIDPGRALSRVPLFFGWAYPLLACAGLWLAGRRLEPAAARLLHIYALAMALVLGLRSVGGVLLQDVKDMLFLGPLVVLLTALALDALGERSAGERRLALGIALGLALLGLCRYGEYLVPRLALAATS